MNASEILDRFYGKETYPTCIEMLDFDIEVFESNLGWTMTDAERHAIIDHLDLRHRLNCRTCGQTFIPSKDEPAHAAGFCSDTCQAEYHGQGL